MQTSAVSTFSSSMAMVNAAHDGLGATATATTVSDAAAEVAYVFCNLGSLIVEGRVPREAEERGYVEGPHVPVHGLAALANRHECSKDSPMCTKDESLRRHMLLLWQNNLPICIEVLLRPDCQLSKTREVEVAASALPEPGSLLLEQWTVAVSDTRVHERVISSRDLFGAVRSYLHFSQLSAWLSSSRGERPKNLLYRVTLPTDAFVMKFKQSPDNHVFPPAKAGNTSTVQVSLKSLPRLEGLPHVHCVHHRQPDQLRRQLLFKNAEKKKSDKLEHQEGAARALIWKEMNVSSESGLDLRKALVRSRLAECSLLSRSDSMDSMLGDSLLDPPQSLLKMPPKRYQSPSRCISPCKEAPELNLACSSSKLVCPKTKRETINEGRLARQDQMRRRDFETQSLHPKLLSTKCRLRGKHLCEHDNDHLDEGHEDLQRTGDSNTSIVHLREAKEARISERIKSRGGSRHFWEEPEMKSGAKRKDILKSECLSPKSNSSWSESWLDASFSDWRLKTGTDIDDDDDDDEVATMTNANEVDVAHLLSLWDEEKKSENELVKKVRDGDTGLDDLEEQLRLLSISSPQSEKRSTGEKVKQSSMQSKCELESDVDAKVELTSTDTATYASSSVSGPSSAPSTVARDAFRKSFDSATNLVFHGRTGLPLTSSPAPLRRGKGNFDFDASITSPKSIKRALFRSNTVKSANWTKSNSKRLLSQSAPASDSNLLGNFEESVLNGRLEPVSTVEGFTAEIGASGAFHPKHLTLPVTVFFYTLSENAAGSSPYLGHINLGKKGYRVPSRGTIQVTLFNPLGTVVKMFVVMYDLSDMPANSQTFLRQRTLSMPADASVDDEQAEKLNKWLRYLIHLRFASSRSGKLYLHTDIRLIIFRKSDLDTANEYAVASKCFELRSFTRGPTNPKFSPRK